MKVIIRIYGRGWGPRGPRSDWFFRQSLREIQFFFPFFHPPVLHARDWANLANSIFADFFRQIFYLASEVFPRPGDYRPGARAISFPLHPIPSPPGGGEAWNSRTPIIPANLVFRQHSHSYLIRGEDFPDKTRNVQKYLLLFFSSDMEIPRISHFLFTFSKNFAIFQFWRFPFTRVDCRKISPPFDKIKVQYKNILI